MTESVWNALQVNITFASEGNVCNLTPQAEEMTLTICKLLNSQCGGEPNKKMFLQNTVTAKCNPISGAII